MKGKKLSESLKEVRSALVLNQQDMGKRLGMKLKMYSLYETGKYDKAPADNLNIQRLQKKIADIKKELINDATKPSPQKNDHLIEELQNENKELRQEVTNLRNENTILLKQLLRKTQKVIAQGTHHNNRKS